MFLSRLQCRHSWVFPCSKDSVRGPVAQWTRHLTTNQGIAGSSPARIKLFLQRYLEIWDTTVEAVIAKKTLIFLSFTLSANPAQTQKLKQEGLSLWVHLNPNESPFIPFMSPKWKCVAKFHVGFFFILKTWKVFNNNHIDKQKESTVTGLEPAIPRSEVWCLIH